jgi:hypothetical protein
MVGVDQHGSVNDILETVEWSPRHRKNIIDPNTNTLWLWFGTNFDIMVQDFAYIK